MVDYDNVRLEELDTSKFFVDPKSANFAKILKAKNKRFNIYSTEAGLPELKVLKYIALMYDPASEIRTNIAHLPSRKRICANIVEFETEGNRFIPIVESMLTGQLRNVNRAIVEYCFLSNNIYVVAHAAYQNMYFSEIEKSFQSYDKDLIKNIKDLQDRMVEIESKIFGGEEVMEMKKSLYAVTSKLNNDITPERIVQKLEKGEVLDNPYPDGYLPNKLSYAGIELPE